MTVRMNFLPRGILAAAALVAAPATPLMAQQWGDPPTAAECQAWVSGLSQGGSAALEAVTYGRITGCPQAAPAALASAVRGARASRDTAYLGRLAGVAGQVRDPAVFAAALEVAGDGRASSAGRVLGLLVTVSSLGSSQDVPGYSRPLLFTQTLPATGLCGLALEGGGAVIDNPLASDAARQAARVVDAILYSTGEPAVVQNLARCVRSAFASEIPPQVDVSKIRVDYVCGNTVRVQNHTGAEITLTITTTPAVGDSETEDHPIPGKGGWTSLEVPTAGPIRVTYDGTLIATLANTGRGCGGGG
ncbi:MAG TPA: hypothetical protein VF710_17505 [Longimicrobium sp.]|jgi:hypothetical protein